MAKKMLINAIDPEEYRVAVVENGILEEFYSESPSTEQLKGNIYKAKISNIEPSLQACFANFGGPNDGFLQIDEIHPEYFRTTDDASVRKGNIRRLLSPDQELLVQVVKDASGQKRATLTTYLSIAGRHLVLMPGRTSGGVSRKIEDEKERDRLKQTLKEIPVTEGISVIIRTAAVGKAKRELISEAKSLMRLWSEIRKRGQKGKAPALIYKEQDLSLRFLRDHFSSDIQEIIIDDKEAFRKAIDFMKIISPRHRNRVKRDKGKEPIFSRFDIERQIESIYESRVLLKSGGSIVIQATEALISIDVNSGKATREQDLEETAFRTNLEAAAEAVRQLRLRDLGGLVVLDFIDMRDSRHQKELLKCLRENLKKDRARTRSTNISKFGLVELSRQKMGLPIQSRSYLVCPSCGGKGVLKMPESAAMYQFRKIWRLISSGNIQAVDMYLPVNVGNYLLNQKRASLLNLEHRYDVKIRIWTDPSMGAEESRVDITKREPADTAGAS